MHWKKTAVHTRAHSQPGPSAEPHSSFFQAAFREEGARSGLMDTCRGRNPHCEDPQECARGKALSLSPWAVLAFVSCLGSVTPQPLQSPKHPDLSPHFRVSTSDSGAGNKLGQSALTPYPFLLLHLLPPPPPAQRTCPGCRTGSGWGVALA